MKRVRALVKGRVQGVWYRRSTAEEAARLRVSGWVRNLADGNVEALLQGEEKAVESLLEWCRIGPPDAMVEEIDLLEEEPGELPDGFRVIR